MFMRTDGYQNETLANLQDFLRLIIYSCAPLSKNINVYLINIQRYINSK